MRTTYVPETYGRAGLSKRAWLFGLSLRGRFRYVRAYSNQRRIHPESFTTRHFQKSAASQFLRILSYVRVGSQISWASELGIVTKLALFPLLGIAGLLMLPLVRLFESIRDDSRSYRENPEQAKRSLRNR